MAQVATNSEFTVFICTRINEQNYLILLNEFVYILEGTNTRMFRGGCASVEEHGCSTAAGKTTCFCGGNQCNRSSKIDGAVISTFLMAIVIPFIHKITNGNI